MTCETARKSLSLLLYGELSFDEEELVQLHLDGCPECGKELEREKAMHGALDSREMQISTSLLRECREDLRERLLDHEAAESHPFGWGRDRAGFWRWLERWLPAIPSPRYLRPVSAVALLAVGFFVARLTPPGSTALREAGVLPDPVASKVRYVEPEQGGRVQIVVDETRQRILSGRLDDEQIRRFLLAAAKDPADPGLRGESVEILGMRPEAADIRLALLSALQHDNNAGVRLKALDRLRAYVGDAEVRKALVGVLLSDPNPGLRTQAIDLLTRNGLHEDSGTQLVGALQELMRKEDNSYVRLRCQKALRELNASVETY